MLAKPLPKSWLVHSIDYYKKQSGRDEWGNPKEDEVTTIKRVRFDDGSSFSRDTTQDNINYNGIVFVDAKHSTPKVDFVENSKIVFNGREMVISRIITCYHPESEQVHHYELEVV